LSARIKPRLIVISPFLDKRHGTERPVVEWISRVTDDFDIHIYSQRVEDLDLSKITWHRIPELPGPHLLNYIWWFAANHVWRSWDRIFRGIQADLIFSPGVNCLDADLVSVYIVFAEYSRQLAATLKFTGNPISRWPQLLHRRLYYGLIAILERRIYRNPETILLLIAQRTAAELKEHYGRQESCFVVYLGLDHQTFSPERRSAARGKARNELGYSDERFVILLIGNHWINKGLPVLLEALQSLPDLPIDLLAVGRENPEDYRAMVEEKGLQGRVRFVAPRNDVDFYYAAADVYAGPSTRDTFALPPAEALACGLPVIVSSSNGTSEIIKHGVNGLILEDATDATSLSRMIRQLYEDQNFRAGIGANAARTAREFTWERNARELNAVFEETLHRKAKATPPKLPQEL
jgi:glycosyltransferase involved in cell wall biosynthesis